MEPYTPSSLPDISSVEIVVLRNIEVNRVNDYMRAATAAATHVVRGELAQRIAELWRKLPPGEQSRCHVPPYGLRFLVSDRTICEASLCWECDNLFGEADGRPIHFEFDSDHPDSQALLSLVRGIAETTA